MRNSKAALLYNCKTIIKWCCFYDFCYFKVTIFVLNRVQFINNV